MLSRHPFVLECAVYGVPSSLGEEDDVCYRKREGENFDSNEIKQWLQGKFPLFAIPRYIRMMNELPKTETHRIIKVQLKNEGITSDTVDIGEAIPLRKKVQKFDESTLYGFISINRDGKNYFRRRSTRQYKTTQCQNTWYEGFLKRLICSFRGGIVSLGDLSFVRNGLQIKKWKTSS